MQKSVKYLFIGLLLIAGVTLQSPIQKANFVQYPFIIGVITLLVAFNISTPLLFGLASLLLAGSILYIAVVMLKNLITLPNHSSSSKGILFTLIFPP